VKRNKKIGGILTRGGNGGGLNLATGGYRRRRSEEIRVPGKSWGVKFCKLVCQESIKNDPGKKLVETTREIPGKKRTVGKNAKQFLSDLSARVSLGSVSFDEGSRL